MPERPKTTLTPPISNAEDLDTALKKIAAITDDLRRDEYSLRMISYYYSRDDLSSARTIADKIRDLTARARLLNLIDFRQALISLEGDKVDSIERTIDKFPVGLERGCIKISAYHCRRDVRMIRRNIGLQADITYPHWRDKNSFRREHLR